MLLCMALIAMQLILSSKLIPKMWTLKDILKKPKNKAVVEETRGTGVAQSPALAATSSSSLYTRHVHGIVSNADV